MKKRIRRGLLMTLVAVVAFFYPLLAPMPHRVDETHFNLIEKGMSRAQVEAIFGVPPGEYDWAESDGSALGFFRPAIALRVHTAPSNQLLIGVGANDTLVANSFVITTSGEARWTEVLGAMNGVQLKSPRAMIHYWIAHDPSRARTWTSRHGSFEIQFDEHDRVSWTNQQSEVRIVPPWERAWRWWKSK